MEEGKKRGLVLEGGALRGLFSVGVMDVLMEAGVVFDGIVGVSAGAAFGCNYKSHQPHRALNYNLRFAGDKRYCGLGSLLRTGDLYNAEFAYHVVPNKYDIFDNEAFLADPAEFHVVCTDVDTGLPFYKKVEVAGDTLFEWIRASASMPLAARVVELEGRRLLDGGMTDSIPLRYFQEQGFGRNVVVLTRPAGYVKKVSRFLPLIRLACRRTPQVARVMKARPGMYNAQLAYVAAEEAAGRALVIRPATEIPVGYVSSDKQAMRKAYDMGRQAAEGCLDRIKDFVG